MNVFFTLVLVIGFFIQGLFGFMYAFAYMTDDGPPRPHRSKPLWYKIWAIGTTVIWLTVPALLYWGNDYHKLWAILPWIATSLSVHGLAHWEEDEEDELHNWSGQVPA